MTAQERHNTIRYGGIRSGHSSQVNSGISGWDNAVLCGPARFLHKLFSCTLWTQLVHGRLPPPPAQPLRLCFAIPKVRIISQRALKLLALIHLAHSTHEVLVHSVVALISDGKHTRLCTDIAQVGTIKVLC